MSAVSLQELPAVQSVALHDGAGPLQIHVATEKGLYVSRDEGRNWSLSYPFRLPVTLVASAPDNTLYAFVLGKGLLRIRGQEPMWTPVGNRLGGQVLVELSASSADPRRLVGRNQFGRIIVSDDGGANWHRLASDYRPLSEAAARGRELYVERCQSCHGTDGVGESYTVQSLTQKGYRMAPALDDSAHAWHHTDEALVKTILDGSPATGRMPAWRKKGLTEADARDLVAYIKSLWGRRALECQGPKHMQCMK